MNRETVLSYGGPLYNPIPKFSSKPYRLVEIHLIQNGFYERLEFFLWRQLLSRGQLGQEVQCNSRLLHGSRS